MVSHVENLRSIDTASDDPKYYIKFMLCFASIHVFSTVHAAVICVTKATPNGNTGKHAVYSFGFHALINYFEDSCH